MDISNPRRILAVSLADSTQHLSRVIQELTGTCPEPTAASDSSPTLAGTTHLLPLRTAYYSASVPVWLDVVGDEPAEWATSFLAAEAREVLAALGGLVVVFALPPPSATTAASSPARQLFEHVGRLVRDGLGGNEWDGAGLAVGVVDDRVAAPPATLAQADVDDGGEEDYYDAWDMVCTDAGLEFVLVTAPPGTGKEDAEKRNEFGEKTGIARVLEALEANDWAQAEAPEDDGDDDKFGEFASSEGGRGGAEKDDDGDLDPASLNFGFDRADFAGLRRAIWSAGQEDDDDDGDGVEKVELAMHKLQAVRDMSAGLPEEQRRRMAARAVGEVMKEL